MAPGDMHAGHGDAAAAEVEELSGGAGAAVGILATLSMAMFTLAVLTVFIRLGCKLAWALRRRRRGKAQGALDGESTPSLPPTLTSGDDAQSKELASCKASLSIQGMTCSACSGAVERALGAVEGVTRAQVDLLGHAAEVDFTAPATALKLCDAVEDIGFGASVLQALEGSSRRQVSGSSSPLAETLAIIALEGMTCSACSGAVESALATAPGVKSAKVNLLAQSAQVTFVPPGTTDALCEAVEAIGFGAVLASEQQQMLRTESGLTSMMATSTTSSVERFKAGLPQARSPCLVRIAFASLGQRRAAEDTLRSRSGIAGVVAAGRGKTAELRVSYWSDEVGARLLLRELDGASWAGDSRLDGSDHLWRAEWAMWKRYLLSVPPTTVVFFLAFIIPNLWPDSMEPLYEEVCCGGALSWQTFLLLIFSTPVQFVVGWPMHRSAFMAIRSGHLSMDVLVSLGTTLAFIYSVVVTLVWMIVGIEIPEALMAAEGDAHHGSSGSIAPPPHFFEASAMLLSILLLGKCFEAHAKRRTGDSLHELAALWPTEARVVGEPAPVPTDLLEIGDVVEVTVGETVPCDGEMLEGSDVHMDESILTGEDTPVQKKASDLVVGGSKCRVGAARFRATAVGANTAMSQIARMVQSAQSTRPEIDRLAGRVSRVFVPTILALALLDFVVWAILVAAGAVEVPTAVATSDTVSQTEVRLAEKSFFITRFALALMMMACPCAFGLAAPTAVLVATGAAARSGCLIKSGRAMEVAEQLRAVVLDKTGTVTVGQPRVTGLTLNHRHPLLASVAEPGREPAVSDPNVQTSWVVPPQDMSPGAAAARAAPTLQQAAVLWQAAGAVETRSQHPLGKALSSHAATVVRELPDVEAWKSTTGLGVEGQVAGIGRVRVGRLAWALTGRIPKQPCACSDQKCGCSGLRNCGCECWQVREEESEAQQETEALTALERPQVDTPSSRLDGMSTPLCKCGDDCDCDEDVSCGCTCWLTRGADKEMLELVEHWTGSMGSKGAIVVTVTVDDQFLGAVALRDVLQPGAARAVSHLKSRGIEVWLCSGDQRSTTGAIAAELGIERWIGEAMPQDKARHVADLAATRPVAFVGDGVNDAPALAAASLGVAIGAGAHVTVDAADVVLVRSAFEDFLGFVRLSRRALLTIRMNYVWAFAFNIVGLPLAAGVLYPKVHMPPVVAGAAMAGSSLLVVLNSLRLRSTAVAIVGGEGSKTPVAARATSGKHDSPAAATPAVGLNAGTGTGPSAVPFEPLTHASV